MTPSHCYVKGWTSLVDVRTKPQGEPRGRYLSKESPCRGEAREIRGGPERREPVRNGPCYCKRQGYLLCISSQNQRIQCDCFLTSWLHSSVCSVPCLASSSQRRESPMYVLKRLQRKELVMGCWGETGMGISQDYWSGPGEVAQWLGVLVALVWFGLTLGLVQVTHVVVHNQPHSSQRI